MTRPWLGVLIDLSGTLHIEDSVVGNAVSALQKLRHLPHVEVKFVTNTTKESGRCLFERLQRLGFSVEQNEIFTSLVAARRLIEARNLRPLLLLEPSAVEDFGGIPTNDPNAVVVGLAPSLFNYASLNEAFRLLLGGATLIGIHKARYFKQKDGLSLGPGPFIQALEYASDQKATVVGKPEEAFFHSAIRSMQHGEEILRNGRAVMIGDDARDDVDGAQKAGLKALLVRTGKYRDGDENLVQGGPWKLADDFAAAVDAIEKEFS